MAFLLAVAALFTSPAEIPGDVWNCRNQLEVWCSADGCAAAAPGEFTPMDVWARASGAMSVCAYTGCWEADGAVARANGRIVWTAQDVSFSTADKTASGGDMTLLIIEKDGVGFVRVGGFATPLLCSRAAPARQPGE
ncbi:MAG: hypothetical protein ACE5FO_01365 [Parvularculaceae bacterium]